MFTISKEGSHHTFMKNYPLIIPFMPFLSRAFLLYFYVLENKQNGKKKKCKYTTKFEMQLHGSKIYFQIWHRESNDNGTPQCRILLDGSWTY